jgi:BirA family biotin operon repressor/biotin-[acetyl-CoA-carboxylase] ligase
MQDAPFTDADLNQIVGSTFVERVDFFHTIDSTNQHAMGLAQTSTIHGPLLVLAESQTNGRGRGANRWWADTGALTFTLLLNAGIPPRHLPQASLTVGLAVCEAIEEMVEDAELKLKWPNDVYCQQRKLCGILIELPRTPSQLIAIGIGININNSLRRAPEDLQQTAIALCDVAGQSFSRTEVLVKVLNQLQYRLQCIGRNDEELRVSWREHCLLTNRNVQMNLGSRQISGRCQGIDDEGALVIETDTGVEACFAGSITQF